MITFCSILLYFAKIAITPWSIKRATFYFLISSMKHWPILIIFGVQHQKET